MEQQTNNCQERKRIADFLALSADYIGVEPPSKHTFDRWTARCTCQETPADPSAH